MASELHDSAGQLPAEPIAVDAAGVAQLFCVGVRSIRRWDSSGKLPRGFSIGRRRLWRVDDLRRWAGAGFPGRADIEAARAGAVTER